MGWDLSKIDAKLRAKINEADRIQNGCGVGAVAPRVAERTSVRPLDKGIQKRETRKGSVEIVVTLIACRRRELDDDGNVAAQKPLRDAIAATLGLDDGDSRIRWEYGQCETTGEQGVVVMIQLL